MDAEWWNWEFVAKVSLCCISEECKRWRLNQVGCSNGLSNWTYILFDRKPQIGASLSDYLSAEDMERWNMKISKQLNKEGRCNHCDQEWQPTILEVYLWEDLPSYMAIDLPTSVEVVKEGYWG